MAMMLSGFRESKRTRRMRPSRAGGDKEVVLEGGDELAAVEGHSGGAGGGRQGERGDRAGAPGPAFDRGDGGQLLRARSRTIGHPQRAGSGLPGQASRRPVPGGIDRRGGGLIVGSAPVRVHPQDLAAVRRQVAGQPGVPSIIERDVELSVWPEPHGGRRAGAGCRNAIEQDNGIDERLMRFAEPDDAERRGVGAGRCGVNGVDEAVALELRIDREPEQAAPAEPSSRPRSLRRTQVAGPHRGPGGCGPPVRRRRCGHPGAKATSVGSARPSATNSTRNRIPSVVVSVSGTRSFAAPAGLPAPALKSARTVVFSGTRFSAALAGPPVPALRPARTAVPAPVISTCIGDERALSSASNPAKYAAN